MSKPHLDRNKPPSPQKLRLAVPSRPSAAPPRAPRIKPTAILSPKPPTPQNPAAAPKTILIRPSAASDQKQPKQSTPSTTQPALYAARQSAITIRDAHIRRLLGDVKLADIHNWRAAVWEARGQEIGYVIKGTGPVEDGAWK